MTKNLLQQKLSFSPERLKDPAQVPLKNKFSRAVYIALIKCKTDCDNLPEELIEKNPEL